MKNKTKSKDNNNNSKKNKNEKVKLLAEQRRKAKELKIQERLKIISMKLQNAKNFKTDHNPINPNPPRPKIRKESQLVRNHEDLNDLFADESDFSDTEDVDRKYSPDGFLCRRCNARFDTTDELYYHAKNNHIYRRFYTKAEEIEKHFDDEDRTYCPICDKPIRKHCKSYFVKHLTTHNIESVYACPICFKKFRSESHMKAHRSRHVIDLDDLSDVYKRPDVVG